MFVYFLNRIPEEWLALGMIEGELYPCPALAYIPKLDKKSKNSSGTGNIINDLNNLYDVSIFI